MCSLFKRTGVGAATPRQMMTIHKMNDNYPKELKQMG